MTRLVPREVSELMEAYASVYSPKNYDEHIWEEAGYLTEEFVLESYQVVADYLVNNAIVPGYETAELFMSEMALEDIDNILFETGVLDESYLTEAGFFQGLGARADRAVSGVVNRARQVGQTVSGAAQRAGSAVAGAGRAAASSAQRAGQAVSGAAQRAGSAAVRAATPVAQAVRGTAQRAVSAGQSALGGAVRAGQAAVGGAVRAGQAAAGAAQRAGQAVSGAAQRAGSAVAGAAQGAARRVGQEIEISRRVGAGLPPTATRTTVKASPTPAAPAARPAAAAPAARPAAPAARPAAPAARPAAAAPAARPAAPAARPAAPAARPAATAPTAAPKPATPAPAPAAKPSVASQAADIRSMTAASQARQAAPAPQLSARAQALKAGGPQGGVRGRMLNQDLDLFDVIKGYLLDEGYADNEEAALAIMANMSEEWKQSIVEGGINFSVPSRIDDFNNRRDELKNRYKQDVGPRIPGPSGGGQYGEPPAPKAMGVRLARGTSSSKRGVESKNNA